LICFYYGTLILIGKSNEIFPVTVLQNIFVAMLLILGSFVVTSIFGNIAATMESASKKDTKLSDQINLIQSTMATIRLPLVIQDEVLKYLLLVEEAPEV
jgi:hypothetical protein